MEKIDNFPSGMVFRHDDDPRLDSPQMQPTPELIAFVRDSNLIEGIIRAPTKAEIEATETFLRIGTVTLEALNAFQSVIAPGMPLRDQIGLDVRVGDHVAPTGGLEILGMYGAIIYAANHHHSPWKTHCRFETLHPYCDGNGRTGRILWAWMMQAQGLRPFSLPFLHRWYYQTLSAYRSE